MENNEGQNNYSIIDIVCFIFKMKWIILVIAIIFGIAGYCYSIISYQPYYTATASMVVNVNSKQYINSNGEINQPSADQIFLAQKLIDTYTIILKSKKVMQSVINDLMLDLSPSVVGSYISLVSAKDTQILYVSVSCNDPMLAMSIANSLMKVAPDAMMQTVETGSVNVLDQAGLPSAPSPVSYKKFTLLGIGLGIGLGVAIALIIGILFYKVRTAKDIEERLELTALGELPHIRRKDRNDYQLLINDDKYASFTQAFMMLSNIVHFISDKQNLKTIIVTSAIGGEGKTTIAVNMSLALEKMGKSVLLIDCDFRKSSIRKIFAISTRSSPGIITLLKTNVDIDDCIVKHISGIHIIPCVESVDDAIESSLSLRFRYFLEEMKTRYDYIIIDTSPAYLVSDTASISGYADGTMLVVKQDYSSIKVISDTLLGLKKSGANVLGCVLNDINILSKSSYRSKYYKSYYPSKRGYMKDYRSQGKNTITFS